MSMCHAEDMISSHVRLDDEGREMASTETELASRNPGVAVDVIHSLVLESYRRLTPARIHSYLPILITREVQAELRVRQAA